MKPIVALVCAALLAGCGSAPGTPSPQDLTTTAIVASNPSFSTVDPGTVTAAAAARATLAAPTSNVIMTSVAALLEDSGGGGALPTDLQAAANALELVYNDTALTLVNRSTAAVSTLELALERGTDGFGGSAIPNGSLPGGACFRLALQGAQVDLPEGCQSLYGEAALPDAAALFWRSSEAPGDSLTLMLRGQRVALCPLAQDSTILTCGAQAAMAG